MSHSRPAVPCCAGASPRGKKAARKAADEELRMRQLCHLDELDAAVDGLPSGKHTKSS